MVLYAFTSVNLIYQFLTACKSHTVDIPQSLKDQLRKFRFARRSQGNAALVVKCNKQTLAMEVVEEFPNITVEELAEGLYSA